MAANLTIEEAALIVKKSLVDCSINAGIQWGDNWLFSAYTSDADEGELDPFYSVNMRTGAFSGFSITGDQDTGAIIDAFTNVIEHGDNSGDFLMHYGVKGMRWGVRKDRETGDSKGRKKEGPSGLSVGLEAGTNVLKPIAGQFVPRANLTQKAIIVGANVAQGMAKDVALKTAFASPLAAAGYAFTGLDSGAYRVPVVAARNLARGGWKKNPAMADPNLSVEGIQKKVVSGINKDYPGLGTTNNCLRATYAYEMRRRGYDVAATKTAMASGQTGIGVRIMTKSLNAGTKIPKTNKPTGITSIFKNKRPSENDVFKVLGKQPDGSRGDFQMRWGAMMGGHSVAYEIVKGKPVIFDTQSGKTYQTPAELRALTARAKGFKFNRLDDKDLNSVAITAWVKDSKS